jgi:hypothetical protein
MRSRNPALFAVTIGLLVLLVGVGRWARYRSGADSPDQCTALFIRGLENRDEKLLSRIINAKTLDSIVHLNRDPEWKNTTVFLFAEHRKLRPQTDMWPILQRMAAEIPPEKRVAHYGGFFHGENCVIGGCMSFRISRTPFGTWRITAYGLDAFR